MYDYNSLSPVRRKFVDVAISLLDLTNEITVDQIEYVISNSNIKKPQWLVVPDNRISRGVYGFPAPNATPSTKKTEESDEEMANRISDRYESMEVLINSVAGNVVNSLIVAGAPGLGKSYTVDKVLDQTSNSYVFHRGYMRATHLFRLLYENREKKQTIVIDDCDSIFSDETALNLLKAALELKPVRKIGWGSEREIVTEDKETIPRYFDYEGSIIFLTNLAFYDLIDSGSKYAPHLSAIESRSLVLDLGIKTKREYLTRIRQTVASGMLSLKGFNSQEESDIMQFVEQNVDRLRELSLRTVEKIAALYEANPENWEKLARTVCCR